MPARDIEFGLDSAAYVSVDQSGRTLSGDVVIRNTVEEAVLLADRYRRALKDYGHPPLPVGMHSIGFVARTDEEAVAVQWPYWAEMFSAAADERGWEPPTMEKFRAEIAAGSVYVGSPQTVAAKLAAAIRLLGLSRFDLAYALGRLPHEQRMAAIELYGREVIPRVRELLAADVRKTADQK